MLLLASGIFWLSGLYQYIWHRSTDKPNKQIAVEPIKPIVAPPVSVAPPQPTGNDTSVSKIPLPLLLVGTMPGRNHKEGLAMIGVNKDSPQTYQAGAILVNGVRIAEIYTDHVVLERNNQHVNLYLTGTGEHKVSSQLASLLTVGGEANPVEPVKATHREMLTDYIRPSPVYDKEMLKGYQVYAGQQSGVFSQMGLQAGDIITSLNGVPLTEPQTAIAQLQQLTEGSAMTATIERQGKVETVS